MDKPWAVILDADGSVVACHESEESAQAQVAALYASGSDREAAASGYSARGVVKPTPPVVGPMFYRAREDDPPAKLVDGYITGRLVPYDAPTWVMDKLPDGSVTPPYREGFRRGAFDLLLKEPKRSAGRLDFKHRHDGGRGYVGNGVSLEDREDGLWGTFRVLPGEVDNVNAIMESGTRGLSIEFREREGGTVEDDGVKWRTNVHLYGAALEWEGAYPEAQVLAVRSAMENADRANAEREQDDAAVRERAEAEARIAEAQAAADKAELDAAIARHRRTEEMAQWLAEQERERASLAARYG